MKWILLSFLIESIAEAISPTFGVNPVDLRCSNIVLHLEPNWATLNFFQFVFHRRRIQMQGRGISN